VVFKQVVQRENVKAVLKFLRPSCVNVCYIRNTGLCTRIQVLFRAELLACLIIITNDINCFVLYIYIYIYINREYIYIDDLIGCKIGFDGLCVYAVLYR